jgi:hypothetical protein
MKSANLSSSPRLQRVHKVLQDGREYSTWDIARLAHVCAVNSAISELRWNGLKIQCERRGDKWFYRMGE